MRLRSLCVGAAVAALAALPVAAQSAASQPGSVKHVLLISVDGMHAVDFLNCANGIVTANGGQPFCPAIAALGATGVNYVAASTSKPSDSFPGLTAIVTGGRPALTGVYYDVALQGISTLQLKPPAMALVPDPALPMPHPPGRRASIKRASTSTRPSSTAARPAHR